MPNYSTEELEFLRLQRLPDESRPSFYSRKDKKYIQIGLDFEAYLILQSASQKQETLRWVGRAEEQQDSNENRDALLEWYANNRKTDAELRMSELDVVLSNFVDYQNGLFADGEDLNRWSDLIELQQLTDTLTIPINELVFNREVAFHESNMATLTNSRLALNGTSADMVRELNSWRIVLNTYPGRDV